MHNDSWVSDASNNMNTSNEQLLLFSHTHAWSYIQFRGCLFFKCKIFPSLFSELKEVRIFMHAPSDLHLYGNQLRFLLQLQKEAASLTHWKSESNQTIPRVMLLKRAEILSQFPSSFSFLSFIFIVKREGGWMSSIYFFSVCCRDGSCTRILEGC